ncbi:MAG: DUF2807 domain-containing protein [Alistipes sp.]|nr:DUF2807 domain-containing protein [Alistipes sp.]
MKARFLALISVALCAVSCISSVPYAEGEIEERTYTIEGDITALAASAGFDVVVDATLPKGEVRITTHSDLFEDVEVAVENNSINLNIKSFSRRPKTLKAIAPDYNYDAVAISGGVDLLWEGCYSPNLTLAASGGADAKITAIETENLTVAVSGGADVEIEGICNILSAAVSGGADLMAGTLEAKSADVVASGGADAVVCATESLNIAASGGADVVYIGEPEHTDIKTSGGASVSHR